MPARFVLMVASSCSLFANERGGFEVCADGQRAMKNSNEGKEGVSCAKTPTGASEALALSLGERGVEGFG
jgi:hypothetical protein